MLIDLSYFKMKKALWSYFNKIKITPKYIHECIIDETTPKYMNEIQQGNLFFPREYKLDFSFFKRNYGYEMPKILQAYYSICHPYITGYHKICPFEADEIVLYSTVQQNCFSGLISNAEYFEKYNTFDINKYIPIGWVAYGNVVVLERDTGRIFVEGDNDVEGILYPTPLAENLVTFIQELEPYHTKI